MAALGANCVLASHAILTGHDILFLKKNTASIRAELRCSDSPSLQSGKEEEKMERTLGSNNSEAEKNADGVLTQLRLSLQLLAAPAQAQISHFPAHHVVLTDEMALDFENWAGCVQTYWKLSGEQKAKLTVLDDLLSRLSGSVSGAFWTDEALFRDPRWEEIRNLAKAALVSFGWPVEVPPPARYRNRMLVDGE